MWPPRVSPGAKNPGMKLSTERILTTHVGSLPRSADVVDLLYKKEQRRALRRRRFRCRHHSRCRRRRRASRSPRASTSSATARRARSGYSTYVKDRLSGFAGHHPRPPHLDLAPYPELREAHGSHAGQTGVQARRLRRADRARRSRRDAEGRREPARGSRSAMAPMDAFMNAASPGVISAFQSNHYYPSHEAYVDAIAAAMKPEYDAIRCCRVRAAARLSGSCDGTAYGLSGAQ